MDGTVKHLQSTPSSSQKRAIIKHPRHADGIQT